jgi:hypothetical protein
MKQLGSLSLVLAFVLLSRGEAHAYLDAGSGSMLVQLLLGGTAGLVVLVKLYWRRLLTMIGLRSETSDVTSETDAGTGN